MKVYGPYLRKDGRKHVILYDGKTRTTVSYPKWLMQQHLGRQLEDWETVDHINRDKTDDRIENLAIVSRSEHAALDAVRVRDVQFICVWCGETGSQSPHNLAWNTKRGSAGPFCSHSCSGKYGSALQRGEVEKLPQTLI